MGMANSGVMVLFGGEGLRSELEAVWNRILTLIPAKSPCVIMPGASGGKKIGIVEGRVKLAQETLAGFGVGAEPVMILHREEADDPALAGKLETAGCIIFTGGEPRVLCDVLHGSRAWQVILERQDVGAVLAACGGAVVALGQGGFTPLKPYPAEVGALEYEAFPGLNMLPGRVILPQFNWLPEPVVQKIAAISPPDTVLVGIDDQAALIGDGQRWEVAGLGSVTVLVKGRAAQVYESGQRIP
jgi:cyanophycinase